MSNLEEIRLRAIRFLARREYCEQELTRKLMSRGADPELAKQVVNDLKSRNMVDDDRFAQALVRVRMAKGYGPVKIRNELRQRGVSSELIDRHLEFSAGTWQELIVRQLSRKYNDSQPNDYREWSKRARFLQSRGFHSSQIRETLGEFVRSD